MEQTKENENNVAASIKKQLAKMTAQIDYLIRNNKMLSQLDVDTLMHNTRELYDMLCSVNANLDACSVPLEIENDVFDDNLASVFFGDGQDDEDDAVFDEMEQYDRECQEKEEKIVEEKDDEIVEEEDDEIIEEEDDEIVEEEEEEDEDEEIIEEDDDEIIIEEATPEVEPVENQHKSGTYQTSLFEMDTDAVSLKEAINVDDEFLFSNVLFKGNIDKYNKYISYLDESPNLKAALTYLEEFQTALGWDPESEAYLKLLDYVERRFSN